MTDQATPNPSELENANLKNQAQQLIQTLNARVAEIEAGREVLSETIQQNLSLRTNYKLLNKQLSDANTKIDTLTKEVESLKAQPKEANVKVLQEVSKGK
jgi:regulator of replication initiation timing